MFTAFFGSKRLAGEQREEQGGGGVKRSNTAIASEAGLWLCGVRGIHGNAAVQVAFTSSEIRSTHRV